jgi:phage shock protein A
MPEFTSRIQTMLKAKISAMLDEIENPSETLDFAFEQQRELLQNVRDGIDSVVAAKRRLQQREESLRARAAELDDQARRELASGSEEIARAALRAKAAIETELDTVDDQIDELDQDLKDLSAREQDLTAKLDVFRTQKEAIAAQATADAAEAAGDPSRDMTDLGLAMQRAVEKVGTMGSRADAVEAVGAGPAQARAGAPAEDPIRRLAELEAERSVDEQLARMKRELDSGDVSAT